MYYTCYYCGHTGSDVVRRIEPGYTRHLGLVTYVNSCNICNWQKRGKPDIQYAHWLEAHPEETTQGVPFFDSNRRHFVMRTLDQTRRPLHVY